jgi:nitroimidazol reductase NimA-like FMN-containing flavoprotein (pyridoxamine 5'-phosphate oxidase superfamily)
MGEQPVTIPTGHCRVDDTVYLHGSVGSHFFKHLACGVLVCLAVTHVDGLVLARSVFNHSMNYRSVVAFGKTRFVDNDEERWMAAQRFTEHVIPGRWAQARQPTPRELKKTMFIAVKIDEASVKFRAHGVVDDAQDLGLPVWSGVLPLKLVAQAPQADSAGETAMPLPPYLENYRRA